MRASANCSLEKGHSCSGPTEVAEERSAGEGEFFFGRSFDLASTQQGDDVRANRLSTVLHKHEIPGSNPLVGTVLTFFLIHFSS